MPYQLPTGRLISGEMSFTLGEGDALIQYPQNWLRFATQQELSALNISWVDPEPEVIAPPTKDQLKAAAAAKRYEVETGGITVGGASIDTSRESQGKLTAAWAKAKADDTFTISNWKAADGSFVQLSNATIIAVGDAVLAHVQACFDAEAAVSAEIDAETITTVAQVEASSWPA